MHLRGHYWNAARVHSEYFQQMTKKQHVIQSITKALTIVQTPHKHLKLHNPWKKDTINKNKGHHSLSNILSIKNSTTKIQS